MSVVLLTGATGFVGRQIHRHLDHRGHEVRVVVRPGKAKALISPIAERSVIETGDLFRENADWWTRACDGVDTVIHAAWYVEPGKYLDSARNLDCVTGTLALARGAAAAGVGRFIGIGTCMEYRLPSEKLSIDSALHPATLYGACKLSVYHMLTEFFAKSPTAFSWCRLFYLFGEGEYPARLVPYIRSCLERGETARLSIGTQIRDFLDVREAGAMIAAIVETGQPGAINICSGRPITIRQLAEQIADEYDRRDLLEFGAAPVHPSDPVAVVGLCNAISHLGRPETPHESQVEAQDQSG